ncbi:sodium/potassium/calcium exchanger 3-like [Ischnura elegans]|uniref:sodium/potassium/calcium exchanger 3-like n=1 Tax=Ischnura elegans TaxID=197161 RepID=UPI001ED86F69|nr:sodium/potassium/calcium exchanger 3-like [Ischnura elegans]
MGPGHPHPKSGPVATASDKANCPQPTKLDFPDLDDNVADKANCTQPAILDFPGDAFDATQRRRGAVLLHAAGALYLFAAMAAVCDDYFVPAIGKIARHLHMSEDVAGATFMAAATSSPELFINSVGTFVTEGDLGIGTIVGSAVFNILAVPACCGLFAGKCLQLDWWPLTRDSIAYSISIVLLIISLGDEKVSWQEAFILVISYFMYILVMCYNDSVKDCVERCIHRLSATNPEEVVSLVDKSSLCPGEAEEGGLSEEGRSEERSPPRCNATMVVWRILGWPIHTLLWLTVPDCRRHQRLYPLTFTISILYIGCFSYLVAWMITVIGDTLRIPDSVMGLTFLAAGTSLPEAISSIIVTNKGYGSMGISSSLGSNSFDILICLGIPWLIKSTAMPTQKNEHFVQINSKGMLYSSISLLLAMIVLYILFVFNHFKLDRKIGLVCLLTYAIFVVAATLNELNFYQEVNLPTCGW